MFNFDSQNEEIALFSHSGVVDSRGEFERYFDKHAIDEIFPFGSIAQINVSRNVRTGTVRGLHFQDIETQENKLVSCLSGSIFQVLLDCRKGSKSFGQIKTFSLSAQSGETVLVPAGFAHGFQTTSDDTSLLYLHSAPFESNAYRGVNPLDKRIGIPWPIPISVISEKDLSLPLFEYYTGGIK
jgi:dTDP-4-dehydrorhamnose 3,5-epimerase